MNEVVFGRQMDSTMGAKFSSLIQVAISSSVVPWGHISFVEFCKGVSSWNKYFAWSAHVTQILNHLGILSPSEMAIFQMVPAQVESSFISIRHNVVQVQVAQSSPVHSQIRPADYLPATQINFVNDNDEGSSATHSVQKTFASQDVDAQPDFAQPSTSDEELHMPHAM